MKYSAKFPDCMHYNKKINTADIDIANVNVKNYEINLLKAIKYNNELILHLKNEINKINSLSRDLKRELFSNIHEEVDIKKEFIAAFNRK
jgi:hypothetical protein